MIQHRFQLERNKISCLCASVKFPCRTHGAFQIHVLDNRTTALSDELCKQYFGTRFEEAFDFLIRANSFDDLIAP